MQKHQAPKECFTVVQFTALHYPVLLYSLGWRLLGFMPLLVLHSLRTL